MLMTQQALEQLMKKIKGSDNANIKAISETNSTLNTAVKSVTLSEDGKSIVIENIAGTKNSLLLPDPDDAITGLSMEDTTGILTITKKDGSTSTIDTMLEKVVVNFEYNSESDSLELTLEDGTKQTVALSAFIKDYTTGSTEEDPIQIVVDSSTNKISANIISTGLTTNELSQDINTTLSKVGSISTDVDGLKSSVSTNTSDISNLKLQGHTHDNVADLNKIAEDESGALTYDSKKVLTEDDIDTTEISSSDIDSLWDSITVEA